MKREAIGQVPCHDCTAPVAVKLNANGLAYYACNGELADRMCGATHRFSRTMTRRLVAAVEKQQPAPEPEQEPAREEPPATPPADRGALAELGDRLRSYVRS
jgi:hypothetical protein